MLATWVKTLYCFMIHSKYFSLKKMRTSIDVKFLSSFACSSANSDRMFTIADILQIAVVICRVVFLLFLLCFFFLGYLVRLFFGKRVGFSAIISSSTIASPGASSLTVPFPVNILYNWRHRYQHCKPCFKFGQRLLVMKNLSGDLSQPETEK